MKVSRSIDQAKVNKQTAVKSAIYETLSDFSGHGFSNLIKSKRTVTKLLWGFIIVLSIVFCFTFIVFSLQQYLDFDVVTNIKMKKAEEIEFPAITICDENSFSSLTDRLLMCKYDNEVCDRKAYFEEIEIMVLGYNKTCLRINGKKLGKQVLKTNKRGWGTGFYISFASEHYLSYYVGHNTYKPAFNTDFLEGVLPGKNTDVKLTKTVIKALSSPYSECVENEEYSKSEFSRELVNSGYTYRQENCYDSCFVKYYLLQKCADLGDNCFIELRSSFDFISNCSRLCPIQCDLIAFDFATKEYEITTTYPNISNNGGIIELSIYFTTLQYTELTEFPKMTLTDLVSSVGGTLGKLIF